VTVIEVKNIKYTTKNIKNHMLGRMAFLLGGKNDAIPSHFPQNQFLRFVD
jgi:hypothetical protein